MYLSDPLVHSRLSSSGPTLVGKTHTCIPAHPCVVLWDFLGKPEQKHLKQRGCSSAVPRIVVRCHKIRSSDFYCEEKPCIQARPWSTESASAINSCVSCDSSTSSQAHSSSQTGRIKSWQLAKPKNISHRHALCCCCMNRCAQKTSLFQNMVELCNPAHRAYSMHAYTSYKW